MNEAEKDNALFDDKIVIDKSSCYFCKSDLNDDNTSLFRLSYKTDTKTGVSCLCLLCREVWERLQCEIKSPETELKIRKQLLSEGWTWETLKAKEEREFETIQ